ncbi:hypothetical protein VNO77_40732 [Canavalia gladiata]|uniref:Uncharacterized protein n=1 Tax=Canavalia gladiata TaxID=3824 RepID=A0AAN9K1Q4_CANGL
MIVLVFGSTSKFQFPSPSEKKGGVGEVSFFVGDSCYPNELRWFSNQRVWRAKWFFQSFIPDGMEYFAAKKSEKTKLGEAGKSNHFGSMIDIQSCLYRSEIGFSMTSV